MKTKIEEIRLGGLAIKFVLLSVCLLFVVLSCSPVTDPSEYYAHPNIMEAYKYGDGEFYVWVGNKFYVAPNLHQATTSNTGNKLNIISYTGIGSSLLHFVDSAHPPYYGDTPVYITKGKDTNSLLFTTYCLESPAYSALGELDIPSLKMNFYLDSSYVVSSAVYMPNSTQYVYFYTFGSPKIKAGYYLYNKATNKYSLIFNYASNMLARDEYVHGFDISPDGKKLLSAVSMKGELPVIVEYDLSTKMRDTIKINFERMSGGQFTWLRYNSDGSKILYCCYPENAYAGWARVTNEVGVYDKQRNRKTILPVNTDTRYGSVNVSPVWSSDDKHILYGSGRCANSIAPGGDFSPYIFQDVEGYLREH